MPNQCFKRRKVNCIIWKLFACLKVIRLSESYSLVWKFFACLKVIRFSESYSLVWKLFAFLKVIPLSESYSLVWKLIACLKVIRLSESYSLVWKLFACLKVIRLGIVGPIFVGYAYFSAKNVILTHYVTQEITALAFCLLKSGILLTLFNDPLKQLQYHFLTSTKGRTHFIFWCQNISSSSSREVIRKFIHGWNWAISLSGLHEPQEQHEGSLFQKKVRNRCSFRTGWKFLLI